MRRVTRDETSSHGSPASSGRDFLSRDRLLELRGYCRGEQICEPYEHRPRRSPLDVRRPLGVAIPVGVRSHQDTLAGVSPKHLVVEGVLPA